MTNDKGLNVLQLYRVEHADGSYVGLASTVSDREQEFREEPSEGCIGQLARELIARRRKLAESPEQPELNFVYPEQFRQDWMTIDQDGVAFGLYFPFTEDDRRALAKALVDNQSYVSEAE